MLIPLAQQIINQIFPYNYDLQHYCHQHAGKILQIHLTDVSLNIAVYIHKDGLYLKQHDLENVDVCMVSTLGAVTPFVFGHKTHIKMQVSGELEILEALQKILKKRPMNLSAWLNDHLGLASGTIAYELIQTLDKIMTEKYKHVTEDTKKYLHSEQSYLSINEDITPIKNDMQKLEYQLDRLEFKIKKLLENRHD